MIPSLEYETQLWRQGKLRIVGVDEVGVGPLAGPVVAAACLLPCDCQIIEGVRDSKTLSHAQREALYDQIVKQAVSFAIGSANVREIERLNILAASHLAMQRALGRIASYDHVLVDGREIKDIDLGAHTAIVDGDATSYAIACASIIAKVARDRFMQRIAARHPQYGWEHNCGYGTAEHLLALRTHGATPFHRRTYAPVSAVLSSSSGLCAEEIAPIA